jgi:dihydroflavonol-4-reductase
MPDIARMLARAHPARRIPTRRAPNFIMRTLALFDAEVRTILPNLDQSVRLSADQARRDFGITFRSAESSLLAAADSLLTYKLA